jgi:hypothetical protein
MFVAELDQSGRVDQTDRSTVLAFANGLRFSIRLSGVAKREILTILRRERKGKKEQHTLYILIFATLVYLLLKEHIDKLNTVVIDTEFVGHEATIKDHILNLFRRRDVVVSTDTFVFHQIGKKSPAHELAIKVFRGEAAAGKEITVAEVLAEFGLEHKK